MQSFILPKWFRLLQIVSGLVSLILSSFVLLLGFPNLALDTIITILSITLLTIGVERICLAIMLFLSKTIQKSNHRKNTLFTNIGLGILALVFAIIALLSPRTVSEIPLVLLSIAISVMFNGIGRILQGLLVRHQSTGFRIVTLFLGVLSTGASILVGNSHTFGIIFPIRVLFGILFIHGVATIIFGIIGKLSIEQILKR
jgi:hypothetical protein